MPGLKVMAFSAHAADVIDLAGGTLCKYVDQGHEVMAVLLSLGAKSHVLKQATLDELRASKRAEAERACRVLGIQRLVSLEYEEDPLVLGRAEITHLVGLVRDFRPDIVVSHHPHADTVPDHSDAGRAVWHACHCAGRPGFASDRPVHMVRHLFAYGMGVADTAQRITGAATALPDIYIDITPTVDRKMQALEAFASQQYTPEFNARRKLTLEGRCGGLAGVPYAEPFYSTRPVVMDLLPTYKSDPNLGRRVEGEKSAGV